MCEDDWISADKLPEARDGWSKKDVLCLCAYSYEIGRTRDGKWVDMNNKPIDAKYWQPLPKAIKF